MQQRVEILRALYRGAQVLVLDEPTAVLTPQETQELFRVMRELQAHGTTVVFITHKLDEVLDDRRPDHGAAARQDGRDGRPEGATGASSRARWSAATCAAGREAPANPAMPLPRWRACSRSPTAAARRQRRPFEVRAGEIVGIAGVEGNGQSELAEALTGLRTPTRGRCSRRQATSTGASPRAPRTPGSGSSPRTASDAAWCSTSTIAENLLLREYAARNRRCGRVAAADAERARP